MNFLQFQFLHFMPIMVWTNLFKSHFRIESYWLSHFLSHTLYTSRTKELYSRYWYFLSNISDWVKNSNKFFSGPLNSVYMIGWLYFVHYIYRTASVTLAWILAEANGLNLMMLLNFILLLMSKILVWLNK